MKQILSRLVLCVTAVVPFFKQLGLGGVEGNNNVQWYDLLAEKIPNPLCSLLNSAKVQKEVG